MQHRTGLSLRAILPDLRPLRSAKIDLGGTTHEFQPKINDDHAALLKDLYARY